MTTPTREQVAQLIAELKSGSNWLSGNRNVYSYNRQPKIAAMFLQAFDEQGLPELLSELRKPHDWKLEGFGHYKDVTMAKSDAPFMAADAIESLARADLEATIAEQAAEIARLSINGPCMTRGEHLDGTPWVGSMLDVLNDYKEAAATGGYLTTTLIAAVLLTVEFGGRMTL